MTAGTKSRYWLDYIPRMCGAGPCFHHPQKRVPCPSRVLCERAGPLADVAAADQRIPAKLLTTSGCPMRFNLHCALHPRRIVEGTTPLPILRTNDQPALDRVLMHVIQLFRQFPFTENVEVIVAGLPEGIVASKAPPSRKEREKDGAPDVFVW